MTFKDKILSVSHLVSGTFRAHVQSITGGIEYHTVEGIDFDVHDENIIFDASDDSISFEVENI